MIPEQFSALVVPVAVLLVVALAVLFHKSLMRLFGIIIVPENHIAVVNKKFVLIGGAKTLPEGTVIALNGEAGWQADTLPSGLYKGYWPWQYEIDIQPFIEVPEGKVGCVSANDGTPLIGSGRILGRAVNCSSYQNAREFLANGGERGPQIAVLTPGTYRINTALFKVSMVNAVDIPDETVGVVTTKDGLPLPAGEIAGQTVAGHNSFQNGQAFIDAGGHKGLQEQVVLAGRYYINPLFAEIETKPMTTVPIAHVGVVISYVGREGKDVTGDTFKHGNLVSKGERGVCVEPLDPGKYPINPLTHKVENVPTANVVLNWATGKTESHKLDSNLSTITVRSHDGFTFNLDVSQIIHIPRSEAPKVIARFGNMQNLVTQVLEPTIGNYFRNAAQENDVIEFLKNRRARQDAAKERISDALELYNVVAVDTLIGDITPPQELMKTLTDRKLAEQQKVTFDTQRMAQETRKELQQATAMADTQAQVVDAERQVTIQEFAAKAAVERAKGSAESKKVEAAADAEVAKLSAAGAAQARTMQAEAEAKAVELTGAAEASRVLAIGEAEAEVTKKKIDSMESGNFAGIEIAKHLAQSKQPLVPTMVLGGGANGDHSAVLTAILTNTLQRQLEKPEEVGV